MTINLSNPELVDITISDADMKKIHDGETVTLKDKAGSNTFVVHLKA